jgi:uncharacterized protein YjgD (DUF1641 family)
MARPIEYTPRPARTETTADEELRALLEVCHEHGVLRLAKDLIASNTEIARILVDGLKNPAALNALQNLSILFMAISRLSPEHFYRIVFAAKSALDSLVRTPPQPSQDARNGSSAAPGVVGAYRMLHDDQLWQKLRLLLNALDTFGTSLALKVENPISAFSGKTGRPS